MKHYGLLSLLLLPSLALGQGAPAVSPAPSGTRLVAAAQSQSQRQDEDDVPAPKVPTAQVPSTAPVITVQGLCASSSPAGQAARAKTAPAEGCKTVITRAEFEKLADALNPQMPLPTKRQLAEAYPRMLLFAQKARAMGLEKDPRFLEMMRFATLQLLAQNLTRSIQQKAGNIPDAEIEKYYKDNSTQFQQAELLRIFIPKSKQHSADGAANQPKVDAAADEAAMKTVAQKIHSQAVAGGDFQALQKDAFDAAGIKSQSPNVSLGKITHEGLPTNHQKVFDLQPGQVSELLDDPGGFYIYKVVSKQLVPLDQAKAEIHNFLQQQAFQKEMQSMVSAVKPELNQAYFGGQTPSRRGSPAAPGKPGTPAPGKPGSPTSPK